MLGNDMILSASSMLSKLSEGRSLEWSWKMPKSKMFKKEWEVRTLEKSI